MNVFCHRPAIPNAAVEAAWIQRLKPEFTALGAEPPTALREIYQTFRGNKPMTEMLLATRPAIVSFHFGLPEKDQIAALKEAGILLFGSATSLAEAKQLADAGIDAIVAQGYEAGGHRGLFDYAAPDDRLGAFALTRLLVKNFDLPVIAAGGIMDGAGIAAALQAGRHRRADGHGLCRLSGIRPPIKAIVPRWPARPPITHHDARHFRPPCPVPGQPFYQAGGKRAGCGHPRLPDHL